MATFTTLEQIKKQVAEKGYASLTTAQKEIYNSSLSLPQTPINQPTPPLTPLNPPIAPTIPTAPTLPQTPAPEGNLVEFKNTLSQVVQLAHDKRNELMLKFMMPMQGVMNASDFSSILSSMNRASDKTTEEATKDIFPETKYTGDIKEYQDAKSLGLIGEKTDFFDYLKKKKEATQIEPTDKLKTTDYTNANQFITDNPDAPYEELFNGIIQNTNLTGQEANALLAEKGKTKTKIETIPPSVIGNVKALKSNDASIEDIKQYVEFSGYDVNNSEIQELLKDYNPSESQWYNPFSWF